MKALNLHKRNDKDTQEYVAPVSTRTFTNKRPNLNMTKLPSSKVQRARNILGPPTTGWTGDHR